MQLYLDESGYTGDDLAQSAQPVFVLASLAVDEPTAAAWKDAYFGGVQAAELKHSSMRRYAKQQKLVLAFLTLPQVQAAARVSITHKRYALMCRVIDYVFEPVMRIDGLDLYERGGNIAYANLLWSSIDPFAERELRDELLDAFQDWIRNRTSSSYERFFKPMFSMEGQLVRLLAPAMAVHHRFGDAFFEDVPQKRALDVSIAAAIALISLWSPERKGSITVVHDESSNMAKQRDVWDAIVSPNVPATLIGYDSRKTQFPLDVATTSFRKSIDFAGLQLADVLAGAVAYWAEAHVSGTVESDEYASALDKVLKDYLPRSHTVWPSKDVTPTALGTIGEDAADPIEFMGALIQNAAK